MSNRDSFTFEEWSLVLSAPTFVSAGVAAADPSGIIGAFKEATAGASAFAQFGAQHRDLELLAVLAEDKSFPAMPDPTSLLGEGDAAQQSANFQAAVIARAQAALRIVKERGTPAEAAGYEQLLNAVAQNVADAATEGSVLGIGGVRVSDKEQRFLAALAAALDAADTTVAPAETAPATSPA